MRTSRGYRRETPGTIRQRSLAAGSGRRRRAAMSSAAFSRRFTPRRRVVRELLRPASARILSLRGQNGRRGLCHRRLDDGGIDGNDSHDGRSWLPGDDSHADEKPPCGYDGKGCAQFYGAVCAENGSRGIFITLSSFHPEAQKLLDKVDNPTGVNGDKLLKSRSAAGWGWWKKDGRLCIDEELLLNT